MAADHLGSVAHAERRVARVDALGTEGQVEVAPSHKAPGLEDGAHLVVGGARVRRGLQDDQVPGAQVDRNGPGGAEHRAKVRTSLGGQRGGHADHDRVGVGDHRRIGGCLEASGEHVGDVTVGQIVDVRAA